MLLNGHRKPEQEAGPAFPASSSNSSIILGEANWFSMDGANKPVGWLYQGQWTDSSKMPSDSRYAPAWVHNLSANFLRIDGSTRTLRFTGGSLFDEDFIIRR